jgi:hypothetical protein
LLQLIENDVLIQEMQEKVIAFAWKHADEVIAQKIIDQVQIGHS